MGPDSATAVRRSVNSSRHGHPPGSLVDQVHDDLERLAPGTSLFVYLEQVGSLQAAIWHCIHTAWERGKMPVRRAENECNSAIC